MPESVTTTASLSAPQVRAQLPLRFQGTLQREGESDHRYLSFTIECFWEDEEDSAVLRFRGTFQRIGAPPFGRGFLLAETTVFGFIHLTSRAFQIGEPWQEGEKTRWDTWQGRIPEDLRHLYALRDLPDETTERLHLFGQIEG